jgi:hypothetical protein
VQSLPAAAAGRAGLTAPLKFPPGEESFHRAILSGDSQTGYEGAVNGNGEELPLADELAELAAAVIFIGACLATFQVYPPIAPLDEAKSGGGPLLAPADIDS